MSNNVENRLSNAQEVCIESLLSGKKITEACKEAHISRGAYYVWLKDDELFKDELERRRNEIVESSMEKLRCLMDKAVNKLDSLLTSENEEVARKAANAIIEYSLKWNEAQDLEDRLEEIEKLTLEKRIYRD
jgi:ACT domain-containing protein